MKGRTTLIPKKNRNNFKFTDGTCMYGFWVKCKSDLKCNKEPYSKLLGNKLLKDNYENFKKNKEEKNKDNIKLSQEDKVNELFDKMKGRTTLIPRKNINNFKFTDETSMYNFWVTCKDCLKCDKEPYSKLLENKLLKEDYERYKNKLSHKDKVNELLKEINEIETLIPHKDRNNFEFTDETNMYNFWKKCKRDLKCDKKPYSKLLENELLKEDYEQYKRNNTNTE